LNLVRFNACLRRDSRGLDTSSRVDEVCDIVDLILRETYAVSVPEFYFGTTQ
jgi:hypothetical protein